MTESAPTPPRADPGPHIEVEIVHLHGHVKEGHVHQQGRDFTVISDEGPRTGGDNSAPSPLSYFTLGMGF